MSQTRFQKKRQSKQVEINNMRLPEIEIDQPRLLRNYDSHTNVHLNRSVELNQKQKVSKIYKRREPLEYITKILPQLPSDQPSMPSPRRSESMAMIRKSPHRVHMTLNSVTSSNSIIKKVAHYENRSNSSMEEAVKFSIANSSSSKRNNLIFKRSVPVKFNAR